ncbi:MFS transporter [Pseudodonghicola sp.]|uniref:MFS transporter n=1 Tax=Pseudodonghicola sp. TaxID=1969463 RepID=UPI003A9844F7
MISRRTTAAVGLTQLVNWGLSYYALGVFGPVIAADPEFSSRLTYGGFSLALVVMGLSSGWIGHQIDRHGGRAVMSLGSILLALGFLAVALAHGAVPYLAGWLVLGLGMRMCLYEAAFAALVQAGGAAARPALSQITLLGGLASTVFWPVGHLLQEAIGWRGGMLAYAGIALTMLPFYRLLPAGAGGAVAKPLRRADRFRFAPGQRAAALLFAALVATTAFLSSGLSAHLIGLLSGRGLSIEAAVSLAALPGIAQSCARLAEMVLGRRLDPRHLAVFAAAVLSLGMLVGIGVAGMGLAALIFVLAYGAGNGLLTITRGSLPLVLFPVGDYAVIAGRLIAPSFYGAAAAPVIYATLVDRHGPAAAIGLSALLALTAVACAWGLTRCPATMPD